jgi:predicted transcriptional regulator
VPPPTDPEAGPRPWTFLTNHAHVLILIAGEPEVRMRDLAARVGITERAVHHIVADLEAGGYLKITRHGRRNKYAVNTGLPLRHSIDGHRKLADLVELGLGGKPRKK